MMLWTTNIKKIIVHHQELCTGSWQYFVMNLIIHTVSATRLLLRCMVKYSQLPVLNSWRWTVTCSKLVFLTYTDRSYRGADKSLARPGRKQATVTKLYLLQATKKKIQNAVRPTRSPRQQWPPRRTKSGDLSIVFFSRVGLRTYQHPCYKVR